MKEEYSQAVVWLEDESKDDAFVVPVKTVEEGMMTLSVLGAYDDFRKRNHEVKTKHTGSMALLVEGELKPWKFVSIEDGGKEFTDPMEYLISKYNKYTIVT